MSAEVLGRWTIELERPYRCRAHQILGYFIEDVFSAKDIQIEKTNPLVRSLQKFSNPCDAAFGLIAAQFLHPKAFHLAYLTALSENCDAIAQGFRR